jgi:hypothetical protein
VSAKKNLSSISDHKKHRLKPVRGEGEEKKAELDEASISRCFSFDFKDFNV